MHRDVYELLLLCLAIGTGLLHAEYKGVSKQTLLNSMQAATSSSSSSSGDSGSNRGRSSKSQRLAVSAHHEELLQALVGVRQLAATDDYTVYTVSTTMWLIPQAVCEAGRTCMNEVNSLQRGTDRDPHTIREVVPGALALPLLLTQVEVLALAPPFLSDKLPVLQHMLAIMAGTFEQLRSWTRQQPWQQQRLQRSSPSLRTVQSQLQECVQSVWLQLGPALLALCRRSSGEVEGEADDMTGCHIVSTGSGQQLGGVNPRRVFGTYGDMLMRVMTWTAEWAGHGFRSRWATGNLCFAGGLMS